MEACFKEKLLCTCTNIIWVLFCYVQYVFRLESTLGTLIFIYCRVFVRFNRSSAGRSCQLRSTHHVYTVHSCNTQYTVCNPRKEVRINTQHSTPLSLSPKKVCLHKKSTYSNNHTIQCFEEEIHSHPF